MATDCVLGSVRGRGSVPAAPAGAPEGRAWASLDGEARPGPVLGRAPPAGLRGGTATPQPGKTGSLLHFPENTRYGAKG